MDVFVLVFKPNLIISYLSIYLCINLSIYQSDREKEEIERERRVKRGRKSDRERETRERGERERRERERERVIEKEKEEKEREQQTRTKVVHKNLSQGCKDEKMEVFVRCRRTDVLKNCVFMILAFIKVLIKISP